MKKFLRKQYALLCFLFIISVALIKRAPVVSRTPPFAYNLPLTGESLGHPVNQRRVFATISGSTGGAWGSTNLLPMETSQSVQGQSVPGETRAQTLDTSRTPSPNDSPTRPSGQQQYDSSGSPVVLLGLPTSNPQGPPIVVTVKCKTEDEHQSLDRFHEGLKYLKSEIFHKHFPWILGNSVALPPKALHHLAEIETQLARLNTLLRNAESIPQDTESQESSVFKLTFSSKESRAEVFAALKDVGDVLMSCSQSMPPVPESENPQKESENPQKETQEEVPNGAPVIDPNGTFMYSSALVELLKHRVNYIQALKATQERQRQNRLHQFNKQQEQQLQQARKTQQAQPLPKRQLGQTVRQVQQIQPASPRLQQPGSRPGSGGS